MQVGITKTFLPPVTLGRKVFKYGREILFLFRSFYSGQRPVDRRHERDARASGLCGRALPW
jgi:hypothetical protein